MPDNIPPSTVAPTESPALVSTPPLVPPATAPGSSVNTAQTNPPTQPSSSSDVNVSEAVAQQERRIRDLMSRSDRMANERDQAIARQVEMQNQLVSMQTQTQEHLTMAATTAQTALDRQRQLETEMEQLRAQNLRAQVLLQKPHLAAYQDFLPQTTNQEALNQAVERLEQIRQNDLQQHASTFFPGASATTSPNPAVRANYPGIPSTNPQQPMQMTNSNPQQQVTSPMQLSGSYNPYAPQQPQQRQMPPNTAANPAQMNPMGAMVDPVKSIQELYAKAKASGKAEDFQNAHNQAVQLAEVAARQQFGVN